MEETRKSPNDHGGNKKIVIKMGGGGGGIGAVLLLGGALATAALASVFAIRHKRRSSGSQKSSSEINEKDEGNNQACDEDEHISEGELENDMNCDESFKLEETPLLGENETAEDGEIEWRRHKEEKSDDESKVDESVKEEIGNGEKALEGVGIEEEEEENPDEAIEEKSVIVYQSETRMSEEVSKTSVGEIEKESLVQLVVSEAKENFNAAAAAALPQLMSYEVGGKILEDKVDGKEVELQVGRDHDSSRQRNRIIIWTVCVLSSLSCSCFFHLSLPNLCLLVFFTVFLLQIYGYPLLNRHHAHAQCLQANPKPKPTNKLGNI